VITDFIDNRAAKAGQGSRKRWNPPQETPLVKTLPRRLSTESGHVPTSAGWHDLAVPGVLTGYAL
jgi:hypothetical protein